MKNQAIFTILINKLIPTILTIGEVNLATDGGLLLNPHYNNQVSFGIRIGAESKTGIEGSYRISIIAHIQLHEKWENSQAIVAIFGKSTHKNIMSIDLLGKIGHIHQVNVTVDINIYSDHASKFDVGIVGSIILEILQIAQCLDKDSCDD